MSAIKITAADAWFSKCIRKKAAWICQRCSAEHEEGGLECSHYFGRSNHAVRHDPRNALALCHGCHRYLGSNPHYHQAFIKQLLGEYGYDALAERANDRAIGRQIKRELKEVAAHYKAEFERMETGGTFEGYI